MMEIERKYRVLSEDFKKESVSKHHIIQGFLNSHPDRTVRVRLMDAKGVITVKGRSSLDGTTRFEWEKNIPFEEAKGLLKLCEEGVIEKFRYIIPVGDVVCEVDEFFGENIGLLMAEVELDAADQVFTKPLWLGEEVTGDIRYYNAQLSKNPYTKW